MRRLLEEIHLSSSGPIPVHCDNQSAVRLVFNPESHKRTKHVDVKFFRDYQDWDADCQFHQGLCPQVLGDVLRQTNELGLPKPYPLFSLTLFSHISLEYCDHSVLLPASCK